jgi:DNA helicase II / ATP-dependent DNA helicase PcrA
MDKFEGGYKAACFRPYFLMSTPEYIAEINRATELIEQKQSRQSAFNLSLLKGLKIDYQKELNEDQLDAVTTISGPVLVIAGAGSGKTRVIVYRVAYLLEKGIDPQNILLLTFTRKAAEEMIARAEDLLGDKKAQNITGGTFHSFASSLLRRYSRLLGIAPNFTIIDQGDSDEIIDMMIGRTGAEDDGFPKKTQIREIITKSKNKNSSIRETVYGEFPKLIKYAEKIYAVSQQYDKYKMQNSLMDFDDLITNLRDYLRNNRWFLKAVQQKFSFIMVDEFQDTNAVQKDIVDLIGGWHQNIMVVGDDAQSIYAFRGANLENILVFPRDYPDCRVVKIEQNYRSSQKILEFTNSIIAKAVMGFKKKLYSVTIGEGSPQTKSFSSPEEEAEFIAAKIEELKHGIPCEEIAVLYRAGFHNQHLQIELLRRNIPFVVYGGLKFNERRHVRDFLSYLRVLHNSLDVIAWNRILRLIPGIGSKTADKIINHIKQHQGRIDFSPFEGSLFHSDLLILKEALESAHAEPVSRQIDVLKKYYVPILRRLERNHKTRSRDLDVIHNIGHSYSSDLDSFLSDLTMDPPGDAFRNKKSPVIDRNQEDAVILSTVHSAKGLEWDTVFVIHLLEGLFPSAQSLKSLFDIEEERRLFYVACTRAKKILFLTYPERFYTYREILNKPCRFLETE